jgi:4-amino-4-deoxy-L-arabinose transferase-like glycosyltransferase
VIVALTLLAALPRLAGFGHEGLTHFDEGVYALAGLWSLSPRGLSELDPGVIPYAPPGLPLLIGSAYALFGVSDASALLVAASAGVVTVAVAGWVGRRTFGPGAGAAAAALAALSLAHVAFSRKALTDVPFLLTWLVAVGLGGRFLERPGVGRAVAFGLAVGLAQNFKYNGWVAGGAVVLAAVVGTVADRESRRPAALLRTFGFGTLAAVVAGLEFLPWYAFVESHGGYAALVRHHRSYLGGIETWLPHWRQQLAQVVALSGGMIGGALAWTAAWASAGVATRGGAWFFPKTRWDGARLRLGLILGAAALATMPDLAWWVGLAWSGWLIFDPRPASRVLGAWWVILSVLTPFYHPYARLWLPLHAAGWVMLAGVLVALGPFPGSVTEVAGRALLGNRRVLAQGALTLVCLALARTHWVEAPPRALSIEDVFAPTDGLRTALAELSSTASPFPNDPDANLRVLARRPVAFYLALQGKSRFGLVAEENDLIREPPRDHDWALVDGVQIGEGTANGALWRKIEIRWTRRAVWHLQLDPVTRLDVNPDAPFELYPPDPVSLVLLAQRPVRTPPQLPRPPDRNPNPTEPKR